MKKLKPELILTVGLPRSGKSTWARTQVSEAVIINPDSIRLAIHGQRFLLEAEPLVWFHVKIAIKSAFGAGHKKVILDATSIQKSSRDEWRSKAWNLSFKFFDTSEEVCIERAKKGNREDLIPVIQRMARVQRKDKSSRFQGDYLPGMKP